MPRTACLTNTVLQTHQIDRWCGMFGEFVLVLLCFAVPVTSLLESAMGIEQNLSCNATRSSPAWCELMPACPEQQLHVRRPW